MSIQEDLAKYSGESAEQKLLILRRELLRPILTVQTSARLFQQIGSDLAECLPENINPAELENMINWLGEAAHDLKEILDALTEESAELPGHHLNN